MTMPRIPLSDEPEDDFDDRLPMDGMDDEEPDYDDPCYSGRYGGRPDHA